MTASVDSTAYGWEALRPLRGTFLLIDFRLLAFEDDFALGRVDIPLPGCAAGSLV